MITAASALGYVVPGLLSLARTPMNLVRAVAGLVIGLGLIFGLTLVLAIDTRSDLADTPVKKAQLLRLKKLWDQRTSVGDSHRRLEITAAQGHIVLGWLSSYLPGDLTGRFAFGEQLDAAVTWRIRGLYLNTATEAYAVRGRGGELELDWRSLRVGSLSFPSFALNGLVALGVRMVSATASGRQLLDSVEAVEFHPESMVVAYRRISNRAQAVGDVFSRLFVSDALRQASKRATTALLRFGDQHLRAQPLLPVVQAAFADEDIHSNPVVRAKAATIALGILVGSNHLARLLGMDPNFIRNHKGVRYLRATHLNQRNDWARHFTLSAALEVLSLPRMSDSVGLFKEERDADGGSGFSFADLAADMAGVRFARAVTGSYWAAAGAYARLLEAKPEDLFPAVVDFPENLDTASLRRQFGGVDGAGYDRVLGRIRAALDGCSLLR